MVDFNEVHGKAIDAAKGQIRSGEIWNVAAREPLPSVTALQDAVGGGTVTVIRYRAMPNGHLEPATPRDEHEISEWNVRHRDTPRESFQLPPLWRR